MDLTSNKLTQLPPFLGSFTVLLRLTLSRNQLTHLPSEICYLTSLKVCQHIACCVVVKCAGHALGSGGRTIVIAAV
jgi:hypothetical protein